MDFNGIDIGDFLEQYNPLAFKDDKGRIMSFASYSEAYVEMLRRVWKAGPKYVDLVLFCVDNYQMPFQDAVRFVRSWRSVGITRDELLTDWRLDPNRDNVALIKDLEKVARGLHMLVECKFQKDSFLDAYDKFMSRFPKLRKEDEG